MTTATLDELDIPTTLAQLFAGTAAQIADPYPFYRRLRTEAPAIRVGPVVAVSRYADVVAALRDTETYSSARLSGSRVRNLREKTPAEQSPLLEDLISHEALYMNETDQPDHTRLRSIANFAFTPRRVKALRAQVQELIDQLLDAALVGGDFDLVQALAYPLPYRVICTLLGASTDREEDIRAWSAEIGRAIGTDYSNVDAAHHALDSFRAYLGELIEDHRANPRDDLLHALTAAESEDARLTKAELESMFVLLFFAGHETTTNLIGNSVVALCRNPDQAAVLRADPQLIGASVEEFLRYCNSVQFIHRTSTAPVRIAGLDVAPGETVRLMIGSANRDATVFDRAEELDVRRPKDPRHIGFGHGIHTCLGAWLARMEIELVLTTLLTRFRSMATSEPVHMRPNLMLSGPETLPMRLR